MSVISVVLIFFAVLFFICVLVRIVSVCTERMMFYSEGRVHDFRVTELRIIWKTLRRCGVINPMSLFNSISTLNNCIAMILSEQRRSLKSDEIGIKLLVTKLNKLRAKVALIKADTSHISNTTAIKEGERLCLLSYGNGSFSTTVLCNDKKIICSLPKRLNSKISSDIPPNEWKNRKITAYFWRTNDACYAFDSLVSDVREYHGRTAIFINQCSELDRTQKRQSIRFDCNIKADLFVIKRPDVDFNYVSQTDGIKCTLANISEYGALIKVEGDFKSKQRIKLQFNISSVFIMMFGIIHSTEYNEKEQCTYLHFECTHVDEDMRNTVLNYIYTHVQFDEDELEGVTSVDFNDNMFTDD